MVDASSVVVGDVIIADDANIWPLVAIRGNVNQVRIGGTHQYSGWQHTSCNA
nr:gamma carbonic anhydrase family protein [Candidatus Pantoea persica]